VRTNEGNKAPKSISKNKRGGNRETKRENLEKVKIAKIKPDLPVGCAALCKG